MSLRASQASQALRWMAGLCWIASLFLPAFEATGEVRGYNVLLVGWASVFVLVPAWLANPILLMSLREWDRANTFSLYAWTRFAAIISFTWPLLKMYGFGPSKDMDLTSVSSYSPGLFLWHGSFVMASVGAWFNKRIDDEAERARLLELEHEDP